MLPQFVTNPNPDLYLSDDWFCFDIETTNADRGDASNEKNRLVYGYGYGPNAGPVHFTSLRDLFPILDGCDFAIAHGSKFELKYLIRAGYPVETLLTYDTLLGDYCIAGNRKWPLDLDSVSKRYGGPGKSPLVHSLIHSGVCPSEIPSSLLREYCQQDVEQTVHVFLKQRQLLRDKGLHRVHYLRCLTTPVLADIELNGLFLDKELVSEVYKDYSSQYREVASALDGITGGINMASAQQVADYLYKTLDFEELKDRRGSPIRGKPNNKFPDGQPKTDEATLVALKARTKAQKQFIELRLKESELRKKIGTYCELYMDACGVPFTPLKDKPKKYSHVRGSCIVRGKLNQSVTGTHRLSSSEPNLQNQDVKLKKVIKARKRGWGVLAADYAQLEFRVAGNLAQDAQILDDVTNNADIHSYTSKVLTEAGQPTDRHNAKPHTFKPLYGGTSGTKAEQAYYTAFKKKYKDVDALHTRWIEEVLRTKQLKTVTGLIFYWPNTEAQHSGYITNNEAIRNYPVQSLATADLAPCGTLLLWHEIKARGLKSFLINMVHDSVLLEVPKNEHDEVSELVTECMAKRPVEFFKVLFDYEFNYPIKVEQNYSSHWDYHVED